MLLALSVAACGGRQHSALPTPQTANEALSQFLAAVKANDVTRMGNLWGDPRGPASSFLQPVRLRQQLQTIQKYLDHVGYRIIQGPVAAQPLNPTFTNVPSPDKLRDFQIELQRRECSLVMPITVVRTDRGGWLVYDVHLESAGTPGRGCRATGTGA